MATNTKNRTELKQFFVKNAIPTQGNFADLIDAQLNQAEDGVFKLPDQPLGVVAVVGEQRRALQLYSAYPAPNPDWLISLNPKRVAPAVGNQAGFGIADGAGTTRLLLDTAGNLTVTGSITATTDINYVGLLSKLDVREQTLGTAAIVRVADFRMGHTQRRGGPGRALVDNATSLVLNYANDWQRTEIHSPLTVTGAVEVNVPGAVNAGWGKFAVVTTNSWGDGANQYVTLGAGGGFGIMLNNPHVVWHAGETRASMRFGRSGGTANGAFWDVGTRPNNAFSFSYNGTGDHKLWLGGDGNIGVGTTTPSAKLNVFGGDISIEGGYYRRLRVISDQYWAGIELVARQQQGVAGHPHIDFTHGELDNPNYGIRVYSPSNSALLMESSTGPMTLTISGFTNTHGIAVNNGNNTGVTAGLWLWSPNDSAHVIYSANSSGKSPANNNAVQGFHNSNHRMRFRTASGQGFLFENHAETALVDIASDTGNLWTRGAVYIGGSDLYFTQTDHNHTAIGNTTGHAAIENASNYGALMILGRNMGTPQAANRVVKLWDYLEVNGKLAATAGVLAHSIGLGTQEHGATSFPYETIQMHPTHNLRVCFGSAQRFMLANSGVFTCTALSQTSDVELKTAVEPLPAILDKLLAMRGVGFRWKDDTQGSKREIGLIAQEVEQLFPELVEVGDSGHRSIKYGNFTALLLEAIKQQQHQLESMQQTLNSLRSAVE